MTVPKPILPAYSPGHLLGYKVTNVNYNNDVLQQGARSQLLIEPVTAFPSAPATGDYCPRSDLGAWFRWDGAVWQQMGEASFTTANRPASPPTGYRYFDLTLSALLYYTGAAYVAIQPTGGTAFPAGPVSGQLAFRSDLGAWFRYDGAAWQQMGGASYTTANRPASPPVGYRYFDLTLNALYYFTGTAYAAVPLAAGGLVQEAWTTPTLTNSWSAWGAVPQYRRSTENTVHFIGGVAGGAASTAAFTTGSVVFPSQGRYFACVDTNGTLNMVGVTAAGVVNITAAGRCMFDTIHYPL